MDYARDIKPLFERRCVSCHGRLKQKGGLRLDVGTLILKGAKSGIVVKSGDPKESALWQRLIATDDAERMPPESKPLPQDQVELVARWIREGARVPANESIPSSPADHWAFQPVKRPPVPSVRQSSWVRNPIDAFVLARLEARGWAPTSDATSDAWLRRVFLDLTGLPPSLGEQMRWHSNTRPAARAELIDRLLASPQYGERWGRHWLDVVRYAESNGYERDAAKPFAWRFRDYVIGAFNADRPWNRVIQEMLAGDELPDATSETAIATTYYRLGPWDDEPADPETDRYDQLDDILSTTSLGFLGLNLGCARCHDHKFEPLSTVDYYSLLSVFAPLERPRNGREELTLPAGNPARVAAFLASKASVASADTALPQAYLMHEPRRDPPPTRVLLRGAPGRPGEVVATRVPEILSRERLPEPVPGVRTTGRRKALAQWLSSPSHPLVARVLVNRTWQQHFGEGLVRTPNNFGVSGDAPTHPELLDWLADWFVNEGQWSLKRLHRLILNSHAWQMSTVVDPAKQAADPENRLLWRMPYRRLEVEAIRDSMLAVSGRLNLQMEGPSIFPPVPRAILEGNSDIDKIWKVSDESQASRRTVYAFLKRAMIHPMLEVLDLCDTTQASAKRAVTTVPTQSLTLFNGDFVNAEAVHFAARLRREAGGDARSQIRLAYQLALCRPPTAREAESMSRFLESESLEQLCRAVLNLNEFVYPD